MVLKAKLDNADWTHTRAEEENYEDAMKIIQALKERHGEDIDFMAPSTVPTGPATDIFAPVEGGEAREGRQTGERAWAMAKLCVGSYGFMPSPLQ